MVKALEESIEAIANYQLQDMMNNAVTAPSKFHNLGLRIKSPNVGENILTSCFCSFLHLRHILLLLHILVLFFNMQRKDLALGLFQTNLTSLFNTMKEFSLMEPRIDSRINES